MSRPRLRAARRDGAPAVLVGAVAVLVVGAPRPGAGQPLPPDPPPVPPVVGLAPSRASHGGSCGGSAAPRPGPAPGAPVPARSRASSRGYLGVRLSESSEVSWSGEGLLVRYCAYPMVVSVEPASPAERAGLGAGDTLVAYGARDLLRDGPIPLDQLLVPGETLRVRIRRDGRTLTRPVVVGERPHTTAWAFGAGPGGARSVHPAAPARPAPDWVGSPRVQRRWQLRGDPQDAAAVEAEGDHPREPPVAGGGDGPVRVRVLTRRPVPAREPVGVRDRALAELRLLDALGRDAFAGDVLMQDVLERARAGDAPLVAYLRALPSRSASALTAFGPAALAGAQLVALDDDLRDAVAGAPARGVFVLKVLPGTPAGEAGLRAGDVIVAAAGRPVETPAALQRALAFRARMRPAAAPRPSRPTVPAPTEGRAVTLRVERGGSAREVVVRW